MTFTTTPAASRPGPGLMPTILSLFFYKKVAKNLERIGKVAIFAAQMWYAHILAKMIL